MPTGAPFFRSRLAPTLPVGEAAFFGFIREFREKRTSFIKPATDRDGGKGRYASLGDGQRPPSRHGQ